METSSSDFVAFFDWECIRICIQRGYASPDELTAEDIDEANRCAERRLNG
jgi:hypothetical protein